MIAPVLHGNTLYQLSAMVAFSIPVISPRLSQRVRILLCWAACWRVVVKAPGDSSSRKGGASKAIVGWDQSAPVSVGVLGKTPSSPAITFASLGWIAKG